MARITASLERSLQNVSLNHNGGVAGGEAGRLAAPLAPGNLRNTGIIIDLNSHNPLPPQWQQFLDLETGEIYYINRRNGTKTREDPRKAARFGGYSNSEEDSSYDSEGSSSGSSPDSVIDYRDEEDNVLVVAGCKTCLMYFMVMKRVEECPKCSGNLLRFDRPENGFP
ncbi:hypothetical protein HHK36_025241 [Tetracentron sinense]|uniref:WW domain-containing protein n=1 Tax=Tetracentron sinense TaxID=13715 RepID=A0A834YKR5_TETSI|nr:hypothetical protein HHK36_025241 [Tetracentron sinense]